MSDRARTIALAIRDVGGTACRNGRSLRFSRVIDE